jgi:hypothetical protein
MWRAFVLRVVRHLHRQPKPLAQSIHDSVRVGLYTYLQRAHIVANPASLVPYEGIVPLVFVQLYADGNLLARPFPNPKYASTFQYRVLITFSKDNLPPDTAVPGFEDCFERA